MVNCKVCLLPNNNNNDEMKQSMNLLSLLFNGFTLENVSSSSSNP